MKFRWCAIALLILTGCGTLKIDGQVLSPNQATALSAPTTSDTASPTSVAPNLSPVTFPTAQVCQVAFFWGIRSGVCPKAAAVQAPAAFQVYDGGYMLWEQVTGNVYALYNGGTGRQIDQAIIADWPEIQVQTTPPPNHVYPIRGFGRVWQHEKDIRAALGWPLGLEQAYTTQYQLAGTPAQYTYIALPNGQVIEFNPVGTWSVVK
jgi:hypothetical protein